ncbi:MAG: hypothetical protein ACI4E2_04490 [Acetatifactor sp.]
MLKKLRKILVLSLAAIMLLSTVVIASAQDCEHTYCYCAVKHCTGVSDAGIHPHDINGVIVNCHMERRTYECTYRCVQCEKLMYITTITETWHSAEHQ